MGDTKLYLFLLLSAYALAETSIEVTDKEAEAQPELCPLAARYKNFRKYIYEYTAESTNGVAGTANIKNGPKISCKVELEVPQTCSFILHTTECTLSEVTVIDAQGQPVYKSAAGTEFFQAAMEKNPLNFVVEQVTTLSIYPEKDEPENIVNIKRGIISALLVPAQEEEHNKKMATIHGLCDTDLTVNTRKDIDVDVTVVRDLSQCSHFSPHKLPTSPLSLLPGLNGLVSKLMSSSQTCNYQFDNKRKHMTEAQCTEKHLFIPFSHEDQYGIVSEVKQSLTLKESVKINNRYFNIDGILERKLFPEEVEEKFFTQTKEDVLTSMRTLNDLTRLGRSQERARLFQKLVSQIRGMKNETLSLAVGEMMEISNWLTWQALFQCGTSECTSAILHILRGFDEPAREVDAIVYALGLLPQASPQRLRDMLSMAQHNPSKAIMYALANTMKKFPSSDALTVPEVKEVAEFMEFMLGDCSGDDDKTFLTLRVIGVMGKYMENFPSLKSSLLSCIRQHDASLSVQKSAIQAFRLMKISSDVSSVLIEQYQDSEAPAQKRIAAYLMLMRNPEIAEEVVKTLRDEQNLQVKSFVISHMANLLDTADPDLQKAKDYITNALEYDESLSAMDLAKFSHNYKIKVPWTGSMESNVIFDSVNYMPREVMLATTLDAFNTEILEIGLEGEGFEPTIEKLFGENGFFPDTISKIMYWAKDQAPAKMSQVLDNWIAPLRGSRMKREVSHNILKQIKENFVEKSDKFFESLKYLKESKDAPKAMAYLRFMGSELGYMKTTELNDIIQNIITYSEIFFSTLPMELLKRLSSGTNNEVFANYIFLDKAFTLPTGAGLPLKFSLAGIFAPGAAGGLMFDRRMQQLSFRPSAGVEFVTQMGVYIPEFVDTGIRMHTNLYHESGLDAKVTMSGSQVKLSIPAPQGNTQLISISNELLSLTSTMTRKVSPIVENRVDSTVCNPVLPGLKYCTIVRYSNASSSNSAPYYPLTGETRFAVELQPTGDVSEYTATIAYELLREGKEERHKVDTLTCSLKAEGATPTTANAIFKYNRNKKIFTSELQIPDYDVEAGIKIEVTDGTGKGKSMHGITIDITKKKNIQLSLVARARLESMEDGLLELEMAVPGIQMDASATASLKNANGLVLQLETAFNCPETSSLQKTILRYDENKVELEIKSDINSEVTKHLPSMDSSVKQLQTFIDNILDQKVAKTDMKLRHIVSKGIEAINNSLYKFGKDIPYVNNLRNKRYIPSLMMPSVPETLYLKSDALFRYQFNKDKIFFSLPLPFGGKSSEDLNIPSTFTLPYIQVPSLGLIKSETKHQIPSFTIPHSLDFFLPQLGVAEVSAKVNSNFYDWEGSISGGNYTVDIPSFIAKYKVKASGPVAPLSYEVEGTALVYGTMDDHFKYLVNGSLNHSFLDASFSVFESITVTKSMTWDDRINSKGTGTYKYEASSPFGLKTSLYYSTQTSVTDFDITGDANLDGVLKIGPLYANSAYTQTYNMNIRERKGKGESILRFDSSVIQGKNVIKGEYLNDELLIVSKTNSEDDAWKHVGEMRYKDGQLFLKSDVSAVALGKTLKSQTELDWTKEEVSFRVETQADDSTNRAYSLLTASLNDNGLEVNMDGSLNFQDSRGTHKGTLTLGANGLATSCTTTLQCRAMTFENIFNAGIDGTGASMSLVSKGLSQDSTAELSVDGKISDIEVNLNSVFKGNAFEGDARNTLNLGLNKQGLTLSNTMTGTLQKMRTESSHTLTVTLWTLAFRSKTDNYICDGASYNHDIKVNTRPFAASVFSVNKLEIFDVSVSNEGHLKMEPFKIDATGSITGKYGEENTIKSTCGISFSDMAGSVKCDTAAEVLDSQINHNFELDFAGLSSVINSESRLNSRALRLENAIRTMVMPFSLTVDAILNGDGSVKFYGKHTGQLYSKFLLKAEPFAIAESHDWRASATHTLLNGDSAETHIENKFDSMLIPNKQSMLWRFKSKLNNHAYNQEISIYNKEADMGVQLSGVLQTNLFSKLGESGDMSLDNQEFSVSGFLKYDKNSDCHIIYLPFIESLPVAFEKMKTSIVVILESLQQYLNGLDINDLVRQFRENLDEVPKKFSDFMEEIDLENKYNMAKDKVISLVEDYVVTLDDLEESMEHLRIALTKAFIDWATKIRDLKTQIRNVIESGSWSEILKNVGDELKAFDERHDITRTIIRVISAIEDVIRQIDLQKLQDSSVAWLKELDIKYEIKAKIQEKVSELKQVIETFDIKMLVKDLTDYISSYNLAEYMEQLSDYIPSEDIEKVLDSMKDIIVNWIEEYELVEKINYVYLKLGELFQRYEIEKKMEVFLDQAKILIKKYKIRETTQAVVNALKSIPFEHFSDTIFQLLDTIVSQLKLIDIKQNINDLNDYIVIIIRNLKDFDYNEFVDKANEQISKVTNYVNEQIKVYEVPEKIEASRNFLREMQASIIKYLDQLKNTKVAELYKMIKDVIDTTAYKDLKLKILDTLEDMKQRIGDMDIRDEILVYLQRASESYSNMITYIISQFNNLIEEIRKVSKDQEMLDQIHQAVEGVLTFVKTAQIEIQPFTLPLTTLEVPAFQINMARLQDITIPSEITVPAFTVLHLFHVPSLTINFEIIKSKIIEVIDQIQQFKMPELDPEATFGDLRALYMFDLPDFSLPEVKLVELKIPEINIPKLNLQNFEITMLPIPEVKLPQIPFEPCIPAFGKLYGEFKLNSPHYTIMTVAAIQNTTTKSLEPQFKATLTSRATSTLEVLGYSLDAMLQIEAPKMKKIVISETIKANHMAFTIDHEGSLSLKNPSVEVLAKTAAKATTQIYKADFVNNIGVALKNGITVTMDTTYSHNLDIPLMDISSEATITKKSEARFESGTISVTVENEATGKWSVKGYSDEGVHKSHLEYTVNTGTAKLTFDGETNSKSIKMKQSVSAESVILSHINIDVSAETETPFMKKSVLKLTGNAQMEDLKIELTASHNAELIGKVSGTISNSCDFLAQPFEITLDCKNKGSTKIILPLKLSGKVDLQHDYKMVLSSEKQYASWLVLARFNQYKYNHNFILDNNEKDAGIHVNINGEANLDFLTVPLTVPEITVPYIDKKTPVIKEYSLWEDLGLKGLLATPRQSLDIDFKLQYHKNPEKHTFDLDLEPLYNSINENAKLLGAHFELGRDKVLDALTNSYNQARTQFEKFKIDTSNQPPRYFTVPGYTVPILNIQVSAFRAELPAFSYFIPKEVSTPSFKVPMMGFSVPSYILVLPSLELPVLHVPETLRELKLPTVTFPHIQNNIMIPALGNVTYDFSFKSPIISVTSNGGLYNQSDIVIKVGASSTSVFEFLKCKLDGTTSITKKRGLKVATTMSLEHKNAEYTHESTVSLTRRNMEASVANAVNINLPVLTMELNQVLDGNTKTKPNLASKTKLQYTYNLPSLQSEGNGILNHNLAIETLSSYFSLENSLKAKTYGTLLETGHFSESLDSEAAIYLNANGLRSTMKMEIHSDAEYWKTKIWNLDITENLALEASLRRVYSTVEFLSRNEVNIASYSTNGKHSAKGTIEFVPLTTLSGNLNVDISQLSDLGLASIVENMDIAVTSDMQKFTWSGKEQLQSIKHSSDLMMSNDESEIRLEMTESLEGHLAFLKYIKLPIYQKTLWDVLKFDEATSTDQLQFLNVSSHLVYTKNMDGTLFALPATVFENGVAFDIPKITLAVPDWLKQIPQMIREMDQRLEKIDMPDYISLPPTITIPTFDVPLTTLHIPSFILDLQNLKIPNVISSSAFDITLPGLPVVRIPHFEINTEYVKDKMALLLLKLPQYEITIKPFTLPKTFTIGEQTLNLDDITKAMYHLEMPTITIPEQKIEIPQISLHMPASIFIPSFGALSTTVKVSSPIYNNTWTAKMENSEPGFVYTLKSSCTSTMTFLAYDLDAVANVLLENGAVSLDGKCIFTHNDVRVNWKHDLKQNLRIKREEPLAPRLSSHTLDIDVNSQTFADVSFRYASHNSGITSSVSTPSAGFIGFQFTRRSPSQYYAKLFSRSLSTPDKDTDLMSFKVTLRNSEKLNLQTSWQLNGFFEILNGFKVRLPAMTAALHDFINKYHKAHFGMDLNRATLKLKNAISNYIDRAYSEFPKVFDAMQNSAEYVSQQSKEMVTRTINSMPQIDFQEMSSRVSNNVKELLQNYETNVRVLLDAVMKFLSETKFHLPGFEEKLTGQEMYNKMRRSISMAIRRAAGRFTSLMETIADTISSYISGMNISLPGTNVVINGKDLLNDLKLAMRSAQDKVIQAMKRWEGLKLEKLLQNLSDFVKLCIQKAGEFIASLKGEKLKELSTHIRGIYIEASNNPVIQEMSKQIQVAKVNAAEYKDKAKLKVQEVYNEISMENLNSEMSKIITVLENRLRTNAENTLDFAKKASQYTQPYIRVTSKKIDVDVPLPFYWSSFSEWPSMT